MDVETSTLLLRSLVLSILLLLSFGWTIRQLHVHNSFLTGELDEEVFVS